MLFLGLEAWRAAMELFHETLRSTDETFTNGPEHEGVQAGDWDRTRAQRVEGLRSTSVTLLTRAPPRSLLASYNDHYVKSGLDPSPPPVVSKDS